MNVRQLAERFNRLVDEGRGADVVFVSLFGPVIDDHMQDIMDRCNWHVTAVDPYDGRSDCVGLDARPDA